MATALNKGLSNQAAWCLLYLLLFLQTTQTTATGIIMHRRGLTDGDSGSSCGSSSATSEQDSGCGGSASARGNQTTVVSGGTLIQECNVAERTYFRGSILTNAQDNIRPSAVDCCRSCFAKQGCNLWVYCSKEGGCVLPARAFSLSPALAPSVAMQSTDSSSFSNNTENSSSINERSQVISKTLLVPAEFPEQGCQLLTVADFMGSLMGEEVAEHRISGTDISFISGSLVEIELPHLPRYTLLPGSDVQSYNYPCSYSTISNTSCIVTGSVQEVAEACDGDTVCQGFAYLPTGLSSLQRYNGQAVGVLKGGDFDGDELPLTALSDNPSIFLFLKHNAAVPVQLISNMSSSESSSHSGHTSLLWIILPTIAALCLAFTAGVACFIVTRGRKKETRSSSTARDGDNKTIRTGSFITQVGAQPGQTAQSPTKPTQQSFNSVVLQMDGSSKHSSFKSSQCDGDQVARSHSSTAPSSSSSAALLLCSVCGQVQGPARIDETTIQALEQLRLARSLNSTYSPRNSVEEML